MTTLQFTTRLTDICGSAYDSSSYLAMIYFDLYFYNGMANLLTYRAFLGFIF